MFKRRYVSWAQETWISDYIPGPGDRDMFGGDDQVPVTFFSPVINMKTP